MRFEVLRPLNQLSELLEEFKEKRDSHVDRSGVRYDVGRGE